MTVNDTIQEALRAPIDPRRIRELPPGSPAAGSPYLPIADVIRRANEIFGFGGWSFLLGGPPFLLASGDLDGKGEVWAAIGTIRVGGAEYSDMGTNTRSGKGPAALEMAAKGAISDAMKRCFTALGDQFGLVLRDKEANSPDAVWADWNDYMRSRQGTTETPHEGAGTPPARHAPEAAQARTAPQAATRPAPADPGRHVEDETPANALTNWHALNKLMREEEPKLVRSDIEPILGGFSITDLADYLEKHPSETVAHVVVAARQRRRQAVTA